MVITRKRSFLTTPQAQTTHRPHGLRRPSLRALKLSIDTEILNPRRNRKCFEGGGLGITGESLILRGWEARASSIVVGS